jgi:hypothetical protein
MEMKVECIIHGLTEGHRQENGRLGCKICLQDEGQPKAKPAARPEPAPKVSPEEAKKIADQFMKAAKGGKNADTSDLAQELINEVFGGKLPF